MLIRRFIIIIDIFYELFKRTWIIHGSRLLQIRGAGDEAVVKAENS